MLRRIILVLALVVGALAFAQSPGQAAPLGATAQAAIASPLKAEKAYYVYRTYYSRPRYRYRRYYRPRYNYYRPRYRYYRPRYRYYRFY
ncbi:hypothetical protein [uncultured Enterovirga sp.]|uniref:hypothetical protein n=1 Tax=uncultured Enterovirga sp. TaxID=2026352 RepID=UPI0035CAC604